MIISLMKKTINEFVGFMLTVEINLITKNTFITIGVVVQVPRS